MANVTNISVSHYRKVGCRFTKPKQVVFGKEEEANVMRLGFKVKSKSSGRKTVQDTGKIHYGTPLGLVLGPVLFNIFVSDMGSGTECTLGTFADETKLCGTIKKLEGGDAIQKDLRGWPVPTS